MSILMPGRIRQEGIQLYASKQMQVEYLEESKLRAIFPEAELDYNLKDKKAACTCSFFSDKAYCQHLAAVEHYLKQDAKGRELASKWQAEENTLPPIEHSMGRLFLESLAINEDDKLRYRLSAMGHMSPYGSEFWWTLKINRLPDQRSYVIKDIPAFLKFLKQESPYQIGKNYYEKLSVLQFDEASQDLISFLYTLLPDAEKVDLSFLFPNHGRNLILSSGFFKEGVSLMMKLHEFSFEHQGLYKEVHFKTISPEDALFAFTVQVNRHDMELAISEKNHRLVLKDNYLLYRNTFYELNGKQAKLVKQLQTLPIDKDLMKRISFNLEDQPQLASSLLDFKRLGLVKAPAYFDVRDFELIFDFDMGQDQELNLQISFDYGSHMVKSQDELDKLPFTSNPKKEARLLALLREEGFSYGFSSRKPALKTSELYAFFYQTLRAFKKLGKVNLSEKLANLRVMEQASFQIDQKEGFLEVNFDFSTINQTDLERAMTALISQESYFISDKGQLVVFDDETKKVSQVLTYLRAGQSSVTSLQLPVLATYQLAQTFGDIGTVKFSETCQKMLGHLSNPWHFPLPEACLSLPLRDYQVMGVRWLAMLDHYGFGGVLADDMGLGKTIQTIAFLKGKVGETDKVLILAPSSLIYNWKDEFQRFWSESDVTVVYGTKSVREELIRTGQQILITSYTSFRQDIASYQENSYDYLILDEAQFIKNSQTKIAQTLRDFDAKTCFALSGTPLENNVLEIWSIFQIVLPGLLPHKKDFLKMSPQTISRYINPFILRRQKEQVLPELPDLVEMTYYNELENEQKALYLAQLKQIQERLQTTSQENFYRYRMEILSGLTRLRQICDSPSLFMTYDGESGKLASLRQLLSQLKDSGRRALIFSQFKGMLVLAEEILEDLGLAAYKLTGSTSALDRQEMTRAFNKGSRDMFLISLKAGGVGLNLTGADAVILIDLWWNPAVENQAISRAHRLGQQKTVDVYRLITRGTIEEKILDLQESKKELVKQVLDGQDGSKALSLDDIRGILGLE